MEPQISNIEFLIISSTFNLKIFPINNCQILCNISFCDIFCPLWYHHESNQYLTSSHKSLLKRCLLLMVTFYVFYMFDKYVFITSWSQLLWDLIFHRSPNIEIETKETLFLKVQVFYIRNSYIINLVTPKNFGTRKNW